MSSEEFREFINQRLTAAAAEIFEAFEKTINNYRDEVDRYKDMLEIVCKPQMKMHQIELSEQLIDPEPHRPEFSDNGENEENICMNQDGADVLLEKQDIKESQDVCPIKSEQEQEQEFQSQSSPVVLWGKDQDGKDDRREGPMVNIGEDIYLLQRQIVPTRQLRILLQRTELQPLPVISGEHLSEPTRTEEDSQEVGIIQEREWTVPKQEEGQDQSETGSNSDPNSQPGEKPFKCDTCGISFSRKYSLKIHMKVHTGERPYPCKTCGKCFAYKHNLNRHRLIHTGERPAGKAVNKSLIFKSVVKKNSKVRLSEKPHSCEICGKFFANKVSRKNHMFIHTGERPHSCATCGKTFVRSYDLNYHRVVHTGEKPFSCATCGKTFAHSKQLNRHKVVHTGEKPYSCETCGKLFAYEDLLRDHMKIHTGERPYSCATCGKTFVRSYALSCHRVVHTGEKPFSCATCGKCFAHKRQHRDHLRTHTGERPYSCEICSNSFINKGHLNAHMKVHKSEKPYS